MANFAKPTRRNLPPPPQPSDAMDNLSQPEHAPTADRIDGRSLRATGRLTQFTTRITEDLQTEIKVYAAQHKLKYNDFLEQAFDALKQQKQS